MKTFLLAAFLAVLCAAPALAAEDVMASFYGNTAVSTGGPVEIHTHYRADHTFDFVGSAMFMSHTFRGTWVLDGKGNICRTYIGDLPPDTTNPSCAPIVAHKLGDTWKSKDGVRTITLKAGIL
jgi:opacity protein-like surface antigen